VAVIRVGHFDADSVRFHRTDATGTSAGLTAAYRGPVQARTVPLGVVAWTQDGFSFNGTWSGNW
jgi:hypothetical protein